MTTTPRAQHDHTSGDQALPQAAVARNTHLDNASGPAGARAATRGRPERGAVATRCKRSARTAAASPRAAVYWRVSSDDQAKERLPASRTRSGPAASLRSPRAEAGSLWDGIHRRDTTVPT
jgi:hypothetical protein